MPHAHREGMSGLQNNPAELGWDAASREKMPAMSKPHSASCCPKDKVQHHTEPAGSGQGALLGAQCCRGWTPTPSSGQSLGSAEQSLCHEQPKAGCCLQLLSPLFF